MTDRSFSVWLVVVIIVTVLLANGVSSWLQTLAIFDRYDRASAASFKRWTDYNKKVNSALSRVCPPPLGR